MLALKNVMQQLSGTGKALLAVNFYNFETLKGILTAAKSHQRPVILQLSEKTIDYLGLEIAVAIARSALKEYGVRAWIHLDHGGSVNLVKRCLDAGFDSVMIDASEKSLEENIKITSEVVKIAEPYGVNVEAELGFIAKLGQQALQKFTDPHEAKIFVENTGVNCLAVAIGSAHGFYKEPPKLQFEILARIHAATGASLVLHGSSGIPDDDLKKAIRAGITKINLATETKSVFMRSIKGILLTNDDIDIRSVFPKAIEAVSDLIGTKLDVVSPYPISTENL